VVAAVNIYEAKTQLSRLLRRVRAGEEIVIADAGRPIAKLVPIEPPRAARTLGGDRGEVWIAEGAFDPMSEEELATWYDAPLLVPARKKRAPARRAPTSRRK
jgi:prevent-host-death family protein